MFVTELGPFSAGRVEPPRGAADRRRPTRRQHRRVRVRQPRRTRHGHADRQLDPVRGAQRRPELLHVGRRHPVQHQDRQRRRRGGRPHLHVGVRHRDPRRRRPVPVQHRAGHVARRPRPERVPDLRPDGHARGRRADRPARRRRRRHRPGDPIAAPSLVGAASMPDYAPLRDQAIYQIPAMLAAARRTPARPTTRSSSTCACSTCCTAATPASSAQDTLAGYNVNAVALQVPKTALAINGDATNNPVIGVWSTTDRRSAAGHRHRRGRPRRRVRPGVATRQPARQRGRGPALPEGRVQLHLARRSTPRSPPSSTRSCDPILPTLIEAIYGVPAPPTPRNDLFEIFLHGHLQGQRRPRAATRPWCSTSTSTRRTSTPTPRPPRRGRAASSRRRCCASTCRSRRRRSPNSYGVLAGDVAGLPQRAPSRRRRRRHRRPGGRGRRAGRCTWSMASA